MATQPKPPEKFTSAHFLSRKDSEFARSFLPWKMDGSVYGTSLFTVVFYVAFEHLKRTKEFFGSDISSKERLHKSRISLWERVTLIPVTVGYSLYYVEHLHKTVHYGKLYNFVYRSPRFSSTQTDSFPRR